MRGRDRRGNDILRRVRRPGRRAAITGGGRAGRFPAGAPSGSPGFSTTRVRPGYDMKQVDAFLDAVHDTLSGVRQPPLTAEEIRNKQFATTRLRPGYHEKEVDAFLEEAEARLRIRCAECGTETAEATQDCSVCGAPAAEQRSVAAEPTADGPGMAVATRQQAPPADQETVQDAPADQQAAPDKSRRNALVMVGVALVALAAVIAAVAIASSSATSSSATSSSARQLTEGQLQPGDCLTGSNLGLGTDSDWPDEVTAVSCTQRHLAEVFFADNVWSQSLAYPGDNAASNQANARCFSAFRAYDGIANSESALTFDYIVPADASDWASGDRLVVCVAWEQPQPGAPLSYSIKGSHR